jgi:hypothetical protein
MSLNLSAITGSVVNVAFGLIADILSDVVLHTGSSNLSVSALVVDVRFEHTNGRTILLGDKKLTIKASDLSAVSPGVGDWFEVDGARFNVRLATLDPTATIWIFLAGKPDERSNVIVVENIAALVALSENATPDLAFVVDRESPYPFYYYVAGDLTVADGANVLEPVHGQGRYFGRPMV